MPRSPQWYQRVPDALAQLRQFPAPVVDRGALELLLGVGRRDAIRLMHRFGGYLSGKTFLIARQALLDQLEAVVSQQAFRQESRRRERLVDVLDRIRWELKARSKRIEVSPDRGELRMHQLSDSITVGPGRLEVAFDGPADLLRRLMELAQAINNDYERFERMTKHA